jgi:hypothetical protein
MMMKKLSSRWTFLEKYVIPSVHFACYGLVIFMCTLFSKNQPLALLVMLFPLVLAVIAFWTLTRYTFPLLDRVVDGGDHLLLGRSKQEDTVQLTDIVEVVFMPNTTRHLSLQSQGFSLNLVNFPRVFLMLKTPSVFGTTVIFVPVLELSLTPLGAIHQLVEKINSVSAHPITLTYTTGRKTFSVGATKKL